MAIAGLLVNEGDAYRVVHVRRSMGAPPARRANRAPGRRAAPPQPLGAEALGGAPRAPCAGAPAQAAATTPPGEGRGDEDAAQAGISPAPPAPRTPSEVILELRRGNTRFRAAGAQHRCLARKPFRQQLPTAAVLCCADAPEHIEHLFDLCLGDLYVARARGSSTASFCFDACLKQAVTHSNVKVVVVLGEALEVREYLEGLREQAAVMSKVKAGALIVTGAKFDCTSGAIEFFDEVTSDETSSPPSSPPMSPVRSVMSCKSFAGTPTRTGPRLARFPWRVTNDFASKPSSPAGCEASSRSPLLTPTASSASIVSSSAVLQEWPEQSPEAGPCWNCAVGDEAPRIDS